LIFIFNQENWKDQLCKIFVDLNLFFWIIDNEQFRKLLQMLCLDLQIVHCIKMIIMILSHHKKIYDRIRLNLTKSQRVFIALNVWFSSQRVTYLRMLIYWIDVEFQFHEHFIEFMFLNIEHIDHQLTMKLMKILKNYVIKNKLFEIIINNASNNSILKDELEKIMNHCKFQWNRTQNFINCLIHIINLII